MYTFKGTDVVINHQDEEFVESGARQLASDIIDGLKTRFPDMTGSVLSAFDIFHVDSIPAQALHGHWKGWNVYGKDELDILINHYSEYKDGQLVRLVVTAECHAQWRQVRNLMKEAHRQKQSTDDFWEEYLMKPAPCAHPEVRKFVELCLVLVLSSVHCERYFSQMNLTKSHQRSRMLTLLLNDLMMIKLNGPECEGLNSPLLQSVLERAYELWRSRKKRFPKRSRTGKRDTRQNPKRAKNGLKIERSIDAHDASDSEDQEAQSEEDTGCVCGDCVSLDDDTSADKVFDKEEMLTL
jgi:hypothetical protein